jgi:hypothetical protein
MYIISHIQTHEDYHAHAYCDFDISITFLIYKLVSQDPQQPYNKAFKYKLFGKLPCHIFFTTLPHIAMLNFFLDYILGEVAF